MEQPREDRGAASAQSASASPPGLQISTQALDDLELRLNGRGVVRKYGEWTFDYVNTYYPHIGQQSYLVPGLHFNKQFFEKEVIQGVGIPLLKQPEQSDYAGNQASTWVLKELTKLSRQLENDSNPLFIINSLCCDGYLARARPPPGGGSIPPRPLKRLEVDVVIVSQQSGVILMEVKATGHPGHVYSDKEFRESVQKAASQLHSQLTKFQHIMPDLEHENITRVAAFPHLSRQRLTQFTGDKYQDIVLLCQDDMCQGQSSSASAGQTNPSPLPSLCAWWAKHFGRAEPGQHKMSVEEMKKVVGRLLGPLSVVNVWTSSKPRLEVRTYSQALSLVGDQFSSIVLTPQQFDLISLPDQPRQEGWRVCVTGCMGSGKTLMLQLKGRQWAAMGLTVVILNVRTTSTGRAAGHALHEAVSRNGGTVRRYDSMLHNLNLEDLKSDFTTDSLKNVCFLLDELSPRHVKCIIPQLKTIFPDSRIWFATLAVSEIQPGFTVRVLTQCLRCPPTVQLLLKMLDKNPLYKDAYCTQSAGLGLPCDGPTISFIRHYEHSKDVRPQHCEQCAQKFYRILKDKLKIVFPGDREADTSAPTSRKQRKFGKSAAKKKHEQWKKTMERVEQPPLSFRDILILVCLPLSSYKQEGDVYRTKLRPVLQFLSFMARSTFLGSLKRWGVPMRYIIDSTSADIARPQEDEVVVTDVLAVPSLERKVVFLLPGGPLLTDQEADISRITRLLYPDDAEPADPEHGEVGLSQATGSQETGPQEAGPRESGPQEKEPQETGPQPQETGPWETGPQPQETGPWETGPQETGPRETGPQETEPRETGPQETRPRETGPQEKEPQETGPLPQETGPREPGSQTGPQETSSHEAGPQETESQMTGPQEIGLLETKVAAFGSEDVNQKPSISMDEAVALLQSVLLGERELPVEELKELIRQVLGNTILPQQKELASNPLSSSATDEHTRERDGQKEAERRRMGAEMRGDSASLKTALKALQEQVAKQRPFPPTTLGAPPTVPNAPSDDPWQAEELRVKEALSMSALSEDDQDTLFMAASRCLSKLIVVLPHPAE